MGGSARFGRSTLCGIFSVDVKCTALKSRVNKVKLEVMGSVLIFK